jgi:molybdenum cofactor synthesis domain-containing protein
MAEYDLLQKNELKFTGVALDRVNLNDVAAAVAEVMELTPAEVLVTDVLENVVTLDILRKTLYPHQVVAKKDALLARIARIPGVTLSPDTTITSAGMLGWIAADETQVKEAMANADAMAAGIMRNLERRVIVFSSGGEVLRGEIEDTNKVTIQQHLESHGYRVAFGATLRDDQDLIAGKLRRATEDGYGLVVTTGGVGAETKDCTVEAILSLDPQAATPYIARFEKGHGRHVKDGVRIAVATVGHSCIVALPGPNDEVRLCLDVLSEGLRNKSGKADLAESLAHVLREKLRDRMRHHGHEHHGHH